MREISNYKNILVYRFGHLGDTLVALPAFWEIRNKFPAASITLLTNRDGKNTDYVAARQVLPGDNLFDAYIFYDNSAGHIKKKLDYAALFFEIRKGKFDCLFYLMPRVRTKKQIERDLKFFRLAGIRRIYGAELLKQNLLDFRQTRPLPTVEPEYKFLLDCLPFETATKYSKDRHGARLTGAEKSSARRWLEQNCGAEFERLRLVAVAPGSKWSSKKWFAGRFIEVLRELIERYDIYPVIFGGGEDRETGDMILNAVGRGANAAGKIGVRESISALEYCELYVGNDTGTMHMAAAAGVPSVGLFAAIDFPGRWYPFGERNEIIRYAVECEGCHTENCFNDHKCLKLIETDAVFRACAKILKK